MAFLGTFLFTSIFWLFVAMSIDAYRMKWKLKADLLASDLRHAEINRDCAESKLEDALAALDKQYDMVNNLEADVKSLKLANEVAWSRVDEAEGWILRVSRDVAQSPMEAEAGMDGLEYEREKPSHAFRFHDVRTSTSQGPASC